MKKDQIANIDNLGKMGGEFSRYLTLRNLCRDQLKLLKELQFENGVLKSDLAEAEDLKTFFRNKYLEAQAKRCVMKTTVKTSISPNFAQLNRILPNLKSRQCWKRCDDCKRLWKETGTAAVHLKMIATVKPGEAGAPVKVSQETRFICDECFLQRNSTE